MPLLPVDRRQIEQWQTITPERSALISNATAPQLHSPRAIDLSQSGHIGRQIINYHLAELLAAMAATGPIAVVQADINPTFAVECIADVQTRLRL